MTRDSQLATGNPLNTTPIPLDTCHVRDCWIPAAILFSVASTLGLILAVGSFLAGGRLHLSAGVVIFCLGVVLIHLLFLGILRRLERRLDDDQKMALLRQQMSMQLKSMESLENNYRIQRQMSHEFEHHLQALKTLLADGRHGEAVDYIERLHRDRALRTISVYSHHPIVDTILNQTHQRAGEHGIHMQIHVNDLSGLPLPTDLLVVIFTNLLDNAVEACLRLDGYREIHCTVLWEEQLFVTIRNTSPVVEISRAAASDLLTGALSPLDTKSSSHCRKHTPSFLLPTTKEPAAEHGFGLTNVALALAQLEAEYTLDYEDGWFQFVAEIPVP